MVKKIAVFIFVEVLLFLVFLGLGKSSLVLHTFEVVPLTQELAESPKDLEFDRMYHLDHPMRYRIDIVSEDGMQAAALLWPKEPFGQFLILVPHQSEELNEQTVFEGQLERCIYKCFPSEMYIEMFGFVEMIENKYPDLKGKYNELPSIVLNTAVTQKGFDGFLEETKAYWIAYGVCILLGLAVLIRAILKDRKD